jgi:hypothetical protein
MSALFSPLMLRPLMNQSGRPPFEYGCLHVRPVTAKTGILSYWWLKFPCGTVERQAYWMVDCKRSHGGMTDIGEDAERWLWMFKGRGIYHTPDRSIARASIFDPHFGFQILHRELWVAEAAMAQGAAIIFSRGGIVDVTEGGQPRSRTSTPLQKTILE